MYQNLFKFKVTGVVMICFICLWIAGCKTPLDPTGPPDHTVNKNGVFHRTGLNDPLVNCVECHGTDLQGGTSGVSCFQCHGQKWSN